MAIPADCALPPEAWNNILTTQTSTYREDIQNDVARSSVYANTIDGGSEDISYKGGEIKTILQNRLSPNRSRVNPTFVDTRLTCGSLPDPDKMGQTVYTTRMESLSGRSQSLCVREAVHTVKNSIKSAIASMKDDIRELWDDDIRSQYLIRSGMKFVAKTGLTWSEKISGGRKQLGVSFVNVLPDAAMSFQALLKLAQSAKETNKSEMFGSGAAAHALVIAGREQIEYFRNEAKVDGNIIAQTTGGYSDGNDAITKMFWTDMGQRGILMNSDEEPLRFNVFDAKGMPVLIEPTEAVESDAGYDAVPRTEWINAKYEIGFMVFKNAFKRLVPKSFMGEGAAKWKPQYAMGELNWHNVVDNACNVKGDTGFFWYEVTRAFQAINPHSVIPFAYKRCESDDGLVACADTELSS